MAAGSAAPSTTASTVASGTAITSADPTASASLTVLSWSTRSTISALARRDVRVADLKGGGERDYGEARATVQTWLSSSSSAAATTTSAAARNTVTAPASATTLTRATG